MNRLFSLSGTVVACVVLIGALEGCTIKATLKTTSDGVFNFLSSTSGRSWWNEDGLVKKEERLNAFVALNYENLKQDMARGRGEYVATLSDLLGVPGDRRDDFSAFTRDRYEILVAGDGTSPLEMLAVLEREIPRGLAAPSAMSSR